MSCKLVRRHISAGITDTNGFRPCYDNSVWLKHRKERAKRLFLQELLNQRLLNLENVITDVEGFGKRKAELHLCNLCSVSHTVCAEAFNPDEDEEEKEPLVITTLLRTFFCWKSDVSSSTLDVVSAGFAGHVPQNRRAEAAAAGSLSGHPPLQELGSSECSSRSSLGLLKDGEHSLRRGRFMAQLRRSFFKSKWQICDCFPTSQEEMSQVLDAMFEKFCTEGEHIIDQDDDGDNFYVIERWFFFSKLDVSQTLHRFLSDLYISFFPFCLHPVGHLTFSWSLTAQRSSSAAMTTEAALENWRWCTTPPGQLQ